MVSNDFKCNQLSQYPARIMTGLSLYLSKTTNFIYFYGQMVELVDTPKKDSVGGDIPCKSIYRFESCPDH